MCVYTVPVKGLDRHTPNGIMCQNVLTVTVGECVCSSYLKERSCFLLHPPVPAGGRSLERGACWGGGACRGEEPGERSLPGAWLLCRLPQTDTSLGGSPCCQGVRVVICPQCPGQGHCMCLYPFIDVHRQFKLLLALCVCVCAFFSSFCFVG